MSTDHIHVRGLTLRAPHGVYEEERVEGREFTVDIDAAVPVVRAGHSDELQHTVDYRGLTSAALSVLEGPSRNLIETLAERICEAVFEQNPPVLQVRVSVWKKATGVPGDPSMVGVTIERANPASGGIPA